jgi:hypothetical protein
VTIKKTKHFRPVILGSLVRQLLARSKDIPHNIEEYSEEIGDPG